MDKTMDKKYWLVLLLPLGIALVFLVQHIQSAQLTHRGLMVDGVTMLPPTQPVRADLQRRAAELLKDTAEKTHITRYSVTNAYYKDPDWILSVAGFEEGVGENWNLEQAGWLGSITITDRQANAAMPGYVTPMHGDEDLSTITGQGGAGNILPFRSGTTAVYGQLGVHECGFSLNGWKAVDLFPSENQVYASMAGEVSYVCRDGNQVALRMGSLLYEHLVDTGQQIGDGYTQGQSLGALVPGTFNTACGYAAQQPDAFHLHWCFIPNSGGTFAADGYALSILNNNWVKGGETVEPTGTLRATWENANVEPPGPSVGINFWDSIVSALFPSAKTSLDKLPKHVNQNISDHFTQTMGAPLELIDALILSNVNMTVVMWVIGIIFVLETVRLMLALVLWVKKIIPDILGFFI